MAAELKGPWDLIEIDEFLSEARVPVRLACIGGDGFPRVVSLWFRYENGKIYCVTHRDSKLVTLLTSNDKVGFEVSPNDPPYHGIRGQGIATLEPLEEVERLEGLLGRYLGGTDSSLATWLLSRCDEELLVTVEPTRIFSWDYRERMADVG